MQIIRVAACIELILIAEKLKDALQKVLRETLKNGRVEAMIANSVS